ncbi:uncharacterized protein TRAVEDRAFT_23137 [Trametes versicolor FP-101664 SS1]|uniref:uncharacterized protein n=1 Tax=Trametes versicolor (strain FP-101664) TaxID=717944 RepID=UPI00046230CC|nr:uncharacterized protein TRAVEDRAFT_23137 [Trametes versicolor FP-101664 SS1]EIW53859.1 hypothetical protein TRAVEDRAFT_23137 [Trametes versicolor FP-101664 SS1]
MQLSQKLNLCSLFLLSMLYVAASRDLPNDSPQNGRSLLPAPGPAPTSATAPTSACVTKCIDDALKQGGCKSLSDTLCFCTQLVLAASVDKCVQRACPTEVNSVFALYENTCAGFGSLPSILPPVLASSSSASQAPAGTAPAASSSLVAQPAPSASAAATTSATVQASTTPAATPSPTSTSNPRVVSSDTAGTEVTVTVTSADANASGSGSALNPTVNGAARAGCSVLGAGVVLLAAAWII